jgi:corrinoid protein of di/trimethylamine methyltransferase
MTVEILENLKRAIKEYDSQSAASLARKIAQEKVDPVKALDAMTEAIKQVGDAFGRGELWLPDLVGASEAMTSATPIIEEEIKKVGAKRRVLGNVVIGTVCGDIHSIGKSMVATLLTANGFAVIDLGINVSAESFIKAVEKYKPDILGMSALLTTTAIEQKKVIEALEKKGLRDKVKVMVGGGAVTQEFADSIGADGYSPTAPGAAELAGSLVGSKGE